MTSGKSRSERSSNKGFGDCSDQLWKKWGSDYHEGEREDRIGFSEKDALTEEEVSSR